MWSQSSTPRQKFYDVMKPIGLFDIENVQIEYLNTIDDAIEKENKYKLIENVVSKNKWYEREIFTMWSNGESARSIHRKTKITLREVLRVIKDIKRQIINEYE
jgi:Mor family transcriptional regulator